MAPDRGRNARDAGPSYQSISPAPPPPNDIDTDAVIEEAEYQRGAERRFLAGHADEPQNFTLRGILVGLGVGLIVCFSNMYFGLQSELFLSYTLISEREDEKQEGTRWSDKRSASTEMERERQ